jgi:serine/threonine protein kinase
VFLDWFWLIVLIHDDIEYLYLIEEYIVGGSLGTILKDSILSDNEVLCLGNDLICALESMYRERIVHRDIKPDNVMFRGNHVDAVLVDFGLVRDLEASSLTQAFHMRGPGTPLYSAPEQLNNQKAMIDWRTDQFALGITLCEAMLGIHPFGAGSPAQTVERIAALEKCNDTTAKQLIERGFKPLVKMLEPYPINRYRTPELLKTDWNRRGI